MSATLLTARRWERCSKRDRHKVWIARRRRNPNPVLDLEQKDFSQHGRNPLIKSLICRGYLTADSIGRLVSESVGSCGLIMHSLSHES